MRTFAELMQTKNNIFFQTTLHFPPFTELQNYKKLCNNNYNNNPTTFDNNYNYNNNNNYNYQLQQSSKTHVERDLIQNFVHPPYKPRIKIEKPPNQPSVPHIKNRINSNSNRPSKSNQNKSDISITETDKQFDTLIYIHYYIYVCVYVCIFKSCRNHRIRHRRLYGKTNSNAKTKIYGDPKDS